MILNYNKLTTSALHLLIEIAVQCTIRLINSAVNNGTLVTLGHIVLENCCLLASQVKILTTTEFHSLFIIKRH